ncbi:MAG: ATPase [Saprospiraceae bacterium]
MKLIVDSGATKAKWALSAHGQIARLALTEGISPYFLDDAAITAIVEKLRGEIPLEQAEEVFFYSTGCSALEQQHRLARLFGFLFPHADTIEIHTDILGAARATCQRDPGVVGILGTGSNACRYADTRIEATIGGFGFILGDEGSGAAIGKDLIVAYLNRELPALLADALQETFQLTRDFILQSVYQRPFPSRFLAGFAPFVHRHRGEEAISGLLARQFSLFLQRNIVPLRADTGLPVHFVGSVAHYFQEAVEIAAKQMAIPVGKFEKDPLPGLAQFHT